MVNGGFNLLVDLILMSMLCIAIYYGVRLNGQMKLLRNARSELNQQLKAFALENQKAQSAIIQMQENAAQNHVELERLLQEGEPLKHELARLIKSSEAAHKRIGQDMHMLNMQENQTKQSPAANGFTPSRTAGLAKGGMDRMQTDSLSRASEFGASEASAGESNANESRASKKSALLHQLRMIGQ